MCERCFLCNACLDAGLTDQMIHPSFTLAEFHPWVLSACCPLHWDECEGCEFYFHADGTAEGLGCVCGEYFCLGCFMKAYDKYGLNPDQANTDSHVITKGCDSCQSTDISTN